MGKGMELKGQKFGRLTVIERSYPNSKQGNRKWLCKCICGKKTIVYGVSLKNGQTKSCGCLHKEIVSNLRKISPGVAAMREVIDFYKRSAKRRGHIYELTEKQFKNITQKDCYYCGAKPSNIQNKQRHNGAYVYNGIDRINNSKGYTIDNIVPCCQKCNYAKRDLTLQEFRDWIKKVYLHQKERGQF